MFKIKFRRVGYVVIIVLISFLTIGLGLYKYNSKAIEKIISDQAAQIIIKYLRSENPEIKCEYDHTDKKDGINYYVIHAYEAMGDHVATIGWYYVNIHTGEAYKWDLASDKLYKLKQRL
jgi:hypothetical protein